MIYNKHPRNLNKHSIRVQRMIIYTYEFSPRKESEGTKKDTKLRCQRLHFNLGEIGFRASC